MNVLVYFFWQQGGLTLGTPDGEAYLCNLVDYAVIPYEITHPESRSQRAGLPGGRPRRPG